MVDLKKVLREIVPYSLNNKTFSEKGYKRNAHIYTVIKTIAGYESKIPFYGVELKKDGEEVLLSPDHGINRVLTNPNSKQTWAEFHKEQSSQYELYGNSFTQATALAARNGIVTKLENLDPANVGEDDKGNLFLNVNGSRTLINPKTLAHIKDYNPDSNSVFGLSPMHPLSKTNQKSNETFERGIALYTNGAPEGMVITDGQGYPLVGEPKKNFWQEWKAKFSGGNKANVPMIVPPGYKWVGTGLKPIDMDMIPASDQDLKTIARAYQIPIPLIMKDGSSVFSDVIKPLKKTFWEDVLIPKLDDKLQNFERLIVPGYNKRDKKNYKIRYDLSSVSVLQEDKQALLTSFLAAMEYGLYTPDEVLIKLGDEPTGAPHGDKYILTKFNSNNERFEE